MVPPWKIHFMNVIMGKFLFFVNKDFTGFGRRWPASPG
jgi:hypothetical protein